ncbi:hypothetical protein WN943_001900 [Citrus x changshan-huyou]
MDKLPEYMKILYKALLDTYNEIEQVLAKEGRSSYLRYDKEKTDSVDYFIELVHFDVWESPDMSMGGAKYMFKARVELEFEKKIKCLRIDNGEEYTDEQMNRTLIERIRAMLKTAGLSIERIRAMLKTAGLSNSLWVEEVKTTCYIVNRSLSTTIGLKTPMEMWTRKLADYSHLHAFGCPVYVIYNAQERAKLDPKSRRCIFLGYADGVKGYRLWDPTAHKIIISRDVIFVEYQLQRRDSDSRTAKEKSEIMPVYVKNNIEKKDSDSFEAALEHEEQEPVESKAPEEEIEVLLPLHKNKTWEFVPLPHGRKAISNKWVYKIKRDGNDQVERYRARLVVKGYAQKEGIDFNEIFSPVVLLTTVRIVLAMCATFDLHLEQLDVKIAFLHGELEEEIYMLQL